MVGKNKRCSISKVYSLQHCQSCTGIASLPSIELALSWLVPGQQDKRINKESSILFMEVSNFHAKKIKIKIPVHPAWSASKLPPVLPLVFHVLAAVLA